MHHMGLRFAELVSANTFLFADLVSANNFLFADWVSANNFLFADLVSANNFLFADRVSANIFLFTDRASAHNLFHFKLLYSNKKRYTDPPKRNHVVHWRRVGSSFVTQAYAYAAEN